MNNKIIMVAAATVACLGGAYWYFFIKGKNSSTTTIASSSSNTNPTTATNTATSTATNPIIWPTAVPSVVTGTVGYAVKAKGTSVNVRREASTTSEIITNVANGKIAGTTTGRSVIKSDGLWYEIKLEFGTGWVRNDVVELVAALKGIPL